MSLILFPLLVLPFAAYNLVVFLLPNLEWKSEIVRVHLMSGADGVLTAGELLVAVSILILAIEALKATRMAQRMTIDHILSVILFVVLLVEFLMVKQAATATFFLLLVASFVEVVAGFAITSGTARGSVRFESGAAA